METTITEHHNELLDYFQMTFENYSNLHVSLITDNTIQDYYGDNFQNVALKITDKDFEDHSWIVLIDNDGDTHYNVYEDYMEEINTPDAMWKYMYFEALGKYCKVSNILEMVKIK